MQFGVKALNLILETILVNNRTLVKKMNYKIEWFHVQQHKTKLVDTLANLAI